MAFHKNECKIQAGISRLYSERERERERERDGTLIYFLGCGQNFFNVKYE